ncbi:MAG: FtsX-like permease family protein [Chloroflexota bacterium]|nr:MAG: FtsX-like permease family protein [Chloroflexota bacterium]
MNLPRHAIRLVLREPRRSLAALVGVTIASTLITSVLLFGAASSSTVTRRALADLPVDAQVVLGQGADAAPARAILTADPAVRNVTAFDLAHFNSASTNKAGTATQTSVGVVLGLDPSFTSATGLFGLSSGSVTPGGIAISRDLASNLGAVPGDTVAFQLPGGGSVSLPVSGIVSIVGADLILGPIDAAHRAVGANPPVNVAVMSLTDLERLVLSKIPAGAVAADPATAGGTPSGVNTPVFAPDPAVRRELHVQIDHAQLPGDPVAAQAWLDTVRRRVERQGAGTITWVDDAAASLEPLAKDLAWGQILFIFLALPGILLALALSRLAADATADATRRHAALLRARGATRRQLGPVFMGATIVTALIGSVLGVAIGVGIGFALFGADLISAGAPGAVLRGGAIAIALTTVLASLAAILPLRAQLAEEIAAGRQELQRGRAPLWQRLYLDILTLIVGAVVYVVAGGSGIHPVLNAEGNPTVTLALTSFVAPLFFWIGGTAVLLRVVTAGLKRTGRLSQVLGRILGPGGELAGRSVTARAAAASRAIVVLALAVGFATSVLVFDATYRQQQVVDAQLTLGADLKATPLAATPASAASNLAGAGIAGVTPFVDRVVYVGPEAQDLLAIDASTLASVAPLSDSFFVKSTAKAAMAALQSRPDAILVSAETAKDYSIVAGDRIRIRVPDASGTLKTIDFTMAGIALEFPTAPKDAFLVANQAYVVAQTGNDRISFVLARADGDVGTASANLARRLGSGWQVADLGTTSARLANSITSVDLSSLVLLDVGFAVLIAGVGVALFLLAGLAERRREFATLIAIGAEPRQVRASMIGEALFIGAAGVSQGLIAGGLVGLALLQILAGIFDPPADSPAIPLVLIGAMTAIVGVSLVGALALADRGLSRLSVVAALRER